MAEVAAQARAPVERIAPDTIRVERSLDAPMEMVWRYLTEAELRGRLLPPISICPRFAIWLRMDGAVYTWSSITIGCRTTTCLIRTATPPSKEPSGPRK